MSVNMALESNKSLKRAIVFKNIFVAKIFYRTIKSF